MCLKEILAGVKCKRKYLRKSEMCSGNAYRITLTYKGKRCSFTFHDNYKNASKKRDFLYCLYLDASCYEQAQDVYDFADSYGYAHTAQCRKAYEGCKKQSERLHKLFTEAEIDYLALLD